MEEQMKAIKELNELRGEINRIDECILNLIEERQSLSLGIVKHKIHEGLKIKDKNREELLLGRLEDMSRHRGLNQESIRKIYGLIIEESVRLQDEFLKDFEALPERDRKIIRVAIQGIEGSYSSLAAAKYFGTLGRNIILISCQRFDEAASKVETGETDYAVIPVENTTSGGINDSYDLLLNTGLFITGEVKHSVKHCLLGLSEGIDKIKRIYAHPQAAIQCSRFIDSLGSLNIEYMTDTALSVKKIHEESNPAYAAIASREAADIYHCRILKENIANQEGNFTRFVVLSKTESSVTGSENIKTSILLSTEQKPGSLASALGVFSKYNLSLSKIESRPVIGNPWQEMFFLSFAGNKNSETVHRAIEELREQSSCLKILGSYISEE